MTDPDEENDITQVEVEEEVGIQFPDSDDDE